MSIEMKNTSTWVATNTENKIAVFNAKEARALLEAHINIEIWCINTNTFKCAKCCNMHDVESFYND